MMKNFFEEENTKTLTDKMTLQSIILTFKRNHLSKLKKKIIIDFLLLEISKKIMKLQKQILMVMKTI